MTIERARLLVSGGLFAALLIATWGAYTPQPGTADIAGTLGAAGGVAGASNSAVARPANTGGEGSSVGTGNAPFDPVLRGRALFLAKGCAGCHRIAGVPGTAPFGPNLTGLAHTAGTRRPGLSAADYVRESLVAPQAYIVPGYASSPTNPGSPGMPRLALDVAEVDALTAFLLAETATGQPGR